MYISVKQAVELWRISDRRVRDLCSQGKVEGLFVRDACGKYLLIHQSR